MIEEGLRVYLSGPMTGYEEYNHPEFNRITKKLEDSGFFNLVINPASMDEGEKPWKYYIVRDLRIIMDLDIEALILMEGWEKSKGARAEVYVATEVLGAKLYLYKDTNDGFTLTPLRYDEATLPSGRVVDHDKTAEVVVRRTQ